MRGEEIDLEKTMKRRASSLSYIPSSISCCRRNEIEGSSSSDSDEVHISSVDHVEELLQKDRMDALLLGMDSLLLLTDAERSQVSSFAAETVLKGSVSGPSVIKDCIHSFIYASPSNDESSPHQGKRLDFASRQQDIMHNTALAVLGNSLQSALEAHSPTLSSLMQNEEWIGDSGIVNVLLSELSRANDRSHDAYQATRCLNALLETSPEMKKELAHRDLQTVVKASQLVGRSRHSLLARECDKALLLMTGR